MKRNDIIFILVLAITLTAIYWNTFGYELIWDSQLLFEKNILFEENRPLSDAVTIGYFREQLGAGNIDFYYRPLLTAFFVMEHKLWGIHAGALRVVNLVIYILALTFFFFFFKKQSPTPYFAEITVLLFALFPLNVDNVVWVVGRGDLLLLFWASLAFLLLTFAWERRRLWHWIGSSLCYLLGILSKESFLYLLPILFVYELVKRRRVTILYHAANVAWTLMFFLVKSRILEIKSIRPLPPADILAAAKTTITSLGYYVRSMVFPIYYDMFQRLSDVDNLFYFLLGIAFILGFLGLLFLARKRTELFIPLSMIAVFVSGHLLLLFTTLFPYKLYARYMMIPGLGLIWIFVSAIGRIKEKTRLALVLILLVVFIPSTIINANAYKSEVDYFLRAHRSSPQDSYILFQTAKALIAQEDYLAAETYLNRTLALPTRKETAILVSLLYADLDFRRAEYERVFRWIDSIEAFELAQYHHLAPLIRYQINGKKALVHIYRGETPQAEALLRENLRDYADQKESYIELYTMYVGTNRWEDAREMEYRLRERFPAVAIKSVQQVRADFTAYTNAEKIAFYIQNRNFRAAEEIILAAGSLDLEHRILLAKLKYWLGNAPAGAEIIGKVAEENSGRPEVLNRLGSFYLQDLFRPQEAYEFYLKSLAVNPAQPEIRYLVERLDRDYLKKLKEVWPERKLSLSPRP